MAQTLKTKPQVMPPVTGTILLTAQLGEGNSEQLPPALTAALWSSLSAAPADLDWRHDYTHDNQLGSSAQYWKGRKPAEGQEDDFVDMLVVDDQLGPAMAREVSDQFAKDPEWDITLDGKRLEPEHELVKLMTDWHLEAGLTAAAKDAAECRWWAGRMVGRVYIPEEYREQLPQVSTLEQALELVHVQAVDPREGGPLLDRHGRTLGYWYRYGHTPEGGEPQTLVEVHTPERVLTFRADGEGLSLEDEADSPFHDPQQPQRARRAEYLMWHADRDGGSVLTQSIRHFQDRLNVVATYKGRNDDQTGYRQFIVTNAEQPKNKKGEVVAFPMGPGVALNIRGLEKPAATVMASEHPDRHTPNWEVLNPLNPEEYHHPSMKGWKSGLLEKLDQLWTLSPETQVSGESKRQSRKPYDRRVAFAGQDAGAFLAWALRAALMLAEQVLGRSEYRGATFQPKLFLDIDAVNLEELRVKLAMWQAGALTLVALLEATPGVTDAAKEAEAVAKGEGTSEESEAKRKALERLAGGEGGGP